MCNIKAISLLVKKLLSKLSFFSKVGQKSRLRSQGQNFRYGQKGLTTRNTYLYYESLISLGSKILAKVMFFFQSRSKVKVKVTRSNFFGMDGKVLPQGIHTCNMKALFL